jgi:hypothetical protein
MSYTGESCGQVTMEIIPEWAGEKQEESADDAETINDVEGLKYLDLRFKVKACTALPAKLAADVRCVEECHMSQRQLHALFLYCFTFVAKLLT